MGDVFSPGCGCCAGLDAETPAAIDNPPGQSAISYRVGIHTSFKESLLARLSSADLPALQGLTSRDDVDFSIALCDALATTLDVLSFYQERIANENLLRTATELRSIVELARLIGYQPSPGVAASTWLAFSLQESPGAPSQAPGPVEIPVGTRVQSVPGPGETPQTFETVEPVKARVEWNAIPVQTSIPWKPKVGDRALWLEGVGAGVAAGDVILLIGHTNDQTLCREIKVLSEVVVDPARQLTRLGWQEGLTVAPAIGIGVFVFRQRAALFGHNAPDPRLLKAPISVTTNHGTQWDSFKNEPDWIDLDSAYPRILPGTWIALSSSSTLKDISVSSTAGTTELLSPEQRSKWFRSLSMGPLVTVGAQAPTARPFQEGLLSNAATEVFQAKTVSFPSRSDFGLAGKVTRIGHGLGKGLAGFGLRETSVLAQSEALSTAPRLLDYPLYGDSLVLESVTPPLSAERTIAVRGKPARIRLRNGTSPQTMFGPGETYAGLIEAGVSLILRGVPERDGKALSPEEFGEILADSANPELSLPILDLSGKEASLKLKAASIELAPAEKADPELEEIVRITAVLPAAAEGEALHRYSLHRALLHCYDRATVRINANVALATHGETVSNEILGSGDARLPDARLPLRQAPLTFISAATPSGRRSTLQVRVNDLLWSEVPSLFEQGANKRVYALATDDQGRSTLQFGNGVEGGRLPSGDHNVRATYRKGLGLGGNLPAGRLTTLLSRPLGVSGVWNPEPASGGEDPESTDRARSNAPLTVRTLDRVVSVRDYRDHARSFAGIAKAHAVWIPVGPARGMFLTVAGEQGAAVSGDLAGKLLQSLRDYGDPLMSVRLASFRSATFRLRLIVKLGVDADREVVMPALEASLRSAFGFERRDFGQGISMDQVAAVAQGVKGVLAVHVAALYPGPPFSADPGPDPTLEPRLFAALPQASLTEPPEPATLLTLDPGPLGLEVMP